MLALVQCEWAKPEVLMRRMFLRWAASLLVCSLTLAGNARGGEEFYVLMFGSQRIPNNPNYAHTFATFVRVCWDGPGPCPKNAQLESHTISWMPANLQPRVMALLPECGTNLDLQASLDLVYTTQQRLSMWGPYPIEPDLYDRAIRKKADLESGRIRYKANDMGYSSNRVTNCIHAISSIVEGPKLRVATQGWGESAAYFVLVDLRPWILSECPHAWVGSALGLDEYPIIYRDFRNPRSNAVVGPVYRLLGGERDLRPTYGPPMK